MSSFSATNSTNINFLGPNRYQIADDRDGDGVRDGQSLKDKIIDEAAANQMLAGHGIKVINGVYQAMDGYNINAANVAAATDFSGDPPLPGLPTGMSPAEIHNKLASIDQQGIDDAALMWATLSTLATTSWRDMQDSKALKNALQRMKIDLKQAEIGSKEQQIEAQKEAAWNKFMWASIGAVAAVGASVAGATIGSNTAAGAGWQAVGSSAYGWTTSMGNALSVTFGPDARASEKELEQLRIQMQSETVEQTLDTARSNYDEAKEMFKLALRILLEFAERQSQITSTITRT